MLGLEKQPMAPKPRSRVGFLSVCVVALVLTSLIFHGTFTIGGSNDYLSTVLGSSEPEGTCPIHEVIRPASYLKDNSTVFKILHDETFREQSAAKLSGAVQVDTTVYDNPPDVPDAPEYWSQFELFHDYLKTTFPTVFDVLEFETVNTWGILLTWKGSDGSLKPSLFMAHQDVVPVQEATLDDWTYPPFEGKYDGYKLYGRGSSDCKSLLIGLMETVELLISTGFQPQRTVLLSFGFDEEAGGLRGARHLGLHIEKKYGKNSIYIILDEGAGLAEFNGQLFGTPASAEKGAVDLLIELTTPGGHSSVPPDHTNIGIMGDLAMEIEADPFEPIFSPKNPLFDLFQCVAVHGELDPALKKSILRSGYDKVANSRVVAFLSASPMYKYLIRTSQAIDIIHGGAKANALPENTKLVVNHRIAIELNVEDVKKRMLERVVKIAKKYDLGVNSYGEEILPETPQGSFKLSGFSDSGLEPAPVSPSSGNVWKFLAGTTRHVFEDAVFPGTKPIPLAPAIMPANTDTKHYWNVTDHIYRFTPILLDMKASNIHSVDENTIFDTHLHIIAFMYEYIQNIDTAEADD